MSRAAVCLLGAGPLAAFTGTTVTTATRLVPGDTHGVHDVFQWRSR
ncbi:hypothetical protein OIE43_12360 [Streptomyces pseudovenezuelae]|uniref:Uncharacterized protein n=1 Tax=Streptomyces pseudovenezuelae TaxID=67350 RepID=A0ABZ1X4I6_9ACTN|nr:hypothetical protein [Streptomyces pseudovenezuelae]WUA88310.1 hypothetical protein OHO81_13810 [Streptomyces pseudovenezuelae]